MLYYVRWELEIILKYACYCCIVLFNQIYFIILMKNMLSDLIFWKYVKCLKNNDVSLCNVQLLPWCGLLLMHFTLFLPWKAIFKALQAFSITYTPCVQVYYHDFIWTRASWCPHGQTENMQDFRASLLKHFIHINSEQHDF